MRLVVVQRCREWCERPVDSETVRQKTEDRTTLQMMHGGGNGGPCSIEAGLDG